jgi:ABC-type transport system involved in multi-copper enzyme maturation permease subunit
MTATWAIFKNTWQQCASGKLRCIVLSIVFLFPILMSTVQLCVNNSFSSELYSKPGDSIILILICACGVIGNQTSEGTLSLLLSRPVTVTRFVFSKWLAIAALASLVSLLQLAAELTVAVCRTPAIINWTDVGLNAFERLLMCLGVSALMILLSSLVSGIKDLGLVMLIYIGEKILQALSMLRVTDVPEGLMRASASALFPAVRVIAAVLNTIMQPGIDMSVLLAGLSIPISEITSYLAVIFVCLALAIFRLNRKELPYGAD